MTYLTIDEDLILECSHPGKFIKNEIEERGWTQAYFAELMGITEAEVSGIIRERKNITPRLAYRISAVFWTSVDLWLWLQKRYDMWKFSENKKEMEIVQKIKYLMSTYSNTSKKETIYA